MKLYKVLMDKHNRLSAQSKILVLRNMISIIYYQHAYPGLDLLQKKIELSRFTNDPTHFNVVIFLKEEGLLPNRRVVDIL